MELRLSCELAGDLKRAPTPCYVIDEQLLIKNLLILESVRIRTGCKVLLALKAFAPFSLFPLIRNYLDGVAASSVDEARLGREEFAKETHVFSPAYSESEFSRILGLGDHIVFNSFSQWRLFRTSALAKQGQKRFAIRVNPEHSEVKTALYDPCAPFSRLGVTRANFEPEQLDGISGLHFHTLCELNSDALVRTLGAFESQFGEFLDRMDWVNFGGGHHITRPDYSIDLLCSAIERFKAKYGVEVYLEPGEAVALNCGFLVASVLDVVQNGMNIAILDTSAATHMPDVLEMPYRPEIAGAGPPGVLPYTYRLGGPTCLAGDIIGDYSFQEPLSVGSKLIFFDMAHYTMVKNNTFNGVRLPSIVLRKKEGGLQVVRAFDYEEYRRRLS
ncbi:MAG: carboxynorspermidine decarboxylase [Syntrophobacteraceae bacterium]